MLDKIAEDYKTNGYAIVRGVFEAKEIREIAQEFDRLKLEGAKHRKTFRHQNILYSIRNDPKTGRFLQFLQWPAYISEILERYRVDLRMLDVVKPFIGDNIKQIINECIWKPPGSHSTFVYHQDCRFRRPSHVYRLLRISYLQTAIAIDPHRPENGCMKLYPGSHVLDDLKLNITHGVLEGEYNEASLKQAELDPEKLTDLVLDPGDVAFWGPYIVHGSGPNCSSIDRRSYVNGYVTAENCDRGEWAFKNGRPCPLGDPVLVQYEDLFTRPEPHYVDGAPNPYRE
jgi:ectoine hydroxylase-related dioxygenase (phytanoyl-CoA dioxygenase family)